MLDKIKGLKKYTDCSMPTNENELRAKESVEGYNQAIEDVVKIFSIYDVSQQRELLIDGFDFINIHDGDRVKIGKLADLVLKSINCG
jgi:hypothetical protein